MDTDMCMCCAHYYDAAAYNIDNFCMHCADRNLIPTDTIGFFRKWAEANPDVPSVELRGRAAPEYYRRINKGKGGRSVCSYRRQLPTMVIIRSRNNKAEHAHSAAHVKRAIYEEIEIIASGLFTFSVLFR